MSSNLVGAVRHTLTQAIEAIRAGMFACLGFGARYLPRSWALGLANLCRYLLSLSPVGVRARQLMRETFPGQQGRAAVLAGQWLGCPFRDHVIAVRVAMGRERTADWVVEMRGEPEFFNDQKQSFIIATGHFSREAMTALYMPWLMKRRLATVVAPLTQSKGPRGTRVRLQMREMLNGIRAIRDGKVDIMEVAGKAFLVRLLHHLRDPGGVVIIASDAAWGSDKSDGISRPFAGFAEQHFALGTARLSRMSQRPIVVCVPFLNGDRRLVMEWGPVIEAPARDDSDADARITNEILDWMERRIGERPGQYVLAFGHERRWSQLAKCWIGADDVETSVAVKAKAAPARVS